MTRREPLTQAEKALLVQRKRAGATLAQIASELGCAVATARKWWRYQRGGHIPRPRGRPARGVLSTYPRPVRDLAVALKQAHPRWGPATVRLELQSRLGLPTADLPSRARLSVLFKTACPAAVQPRQTRTYREQAPPAVHHPHQRWQLDTKENVPVGVNEVASILEIRDPYGALMIASQAFLTTTPRRWRKLTLAEIQATLRIAFAQWGLPLEIQTDREVVYVGSADTNFPSTFTLWLAGLGIQHVVSRSRRPTDQAHVERNHRTLGDLAWKDQALATLADLQQALDASRQRYNEAYPVTAAGCGGRPPLQVYPWARFSGRPFHPALEWETFAMPRVDQLLAQGVWLRQVAANGVVRLGERRYYLGRTYAGQRIAIRFNPATRGFRFETQAGDFIRELPALDLEQADLIGYLPVDLVLTVPYQLPLPFEGV